MDTYAAAPSDVIDYSIDWTAWLDGDTITASTWTVQSGITQTTPAPSFTTTGTTIWLTGGAIGSIYRITNHITTTAGRQRDRSIQVSVQAL